MGYCTSGFIGFHMTTAPFSIFFYLKNALFSYLKHRAMNSEKARQLSNIDMHD